MIWSNCRAARMNLGCTQDPGLRTRRLRIVTTRTLVYFRAVSALDEIPYASDDRYRASPSVRTYACSAIPRHPRRPYAALTAP
jgi:hypothetical protein